MYYQMYPLGDAPNSNPRKAITQSLPYFWLAVAPQCLFTARVPDSKTQIFTALHICFFFPVSSFFPGTQLSMRNFLCTWAFILVLFSLSMQLSPIILIKRKNFPTSFPSLASNSKIYDGFVLNPLFHGGSLVSFEFFPFCLLLRLFFWLSIAIILWLVEKIPSSSPFVTAPLYGQ